MLPHVLCVYFTAGGARGSEAASTAYSIWRFPQQQFGDFPSKDALDTRLPPPTCRHAQSGNRSHHLSVARPTLSPVELTGDPVCVCWQAKAFGHKSFGVVGRDCIPVNQPSNKTFEMHGKLKSREGVDTSVHLQKRFPQDTSGWAGSVITKALRLGSC